MKEIIWGDHCSQTKNTLYFSFPHTYLSIVTLQCYGFWQQVAALSSLVLWEKNCSVYPSLPFLPPIWTALHSSGSMCSCGGFIETKLCWRLLHSKHTLNYPCFSSKVNLVYVCHQNCSSILTHEILFCFQKFVAKTWGSDCSLVLFGGQNPNQKHLLYLNPYTITKNY